MALQCGQAFFLKRCYNCIHTCTRQNCQILVKMVDLNGCTPSGKVYYKVKVKSSVKRSQSVIVTVQNIRCPTTTLKMVK